jgi:hypothetical protein
MAKQTIVWREWYDAEAVDHLAKMGTLPRYETEVDTRFEDGEGVAALIAEDSSNHDGESFNESGRIVILEPSEFAGIYDIAVEYEPTFSASPYFEKPSSMRSETMHIRGSLEGLLPMDGASLLDVGGISPHVPPKLHLIGIGENGERLEAVFDLVEEFPRETLHRDTTDEFFTVTPGKESI